MLNRFSKRHNDLSDILVRFQMPIIALILVNTIGTLGFMIIDDYPFLDAVYQTVFTLTTVGYQETHPISQEGRIFVVVLILGGVGVWSYAIAVTINVVVSHDLIGKIQESFMENRARKFSNHFIIAGYTEITRQVVRSLLRQGIPYIVIDDDPARITQADEDGIVEILSLNPFLNDSFRRANILHARGIVAAFQDDSDNITVVVTGKILEDEINRSIQIITVAGHHESREKLRKVGATTVILPNELIGQRISAMAIHPTDDGQSSFLDRVAFGEFLNLDIREVNVDKSSTLDGVSIRETNIRRDLGAHILGIQRRGNRRLMLMPNPDIHIHAGDQVLIMGTLAQLQKLPEYLRPQKPETSEDN
ncbi:MAG: potassium channel protein [Magnetococcales bacterium]|nr:potassium channel protein [Magnetococcales bacterium]